MCVVQRSLKTISYLTARSFSRRLLAIPEGFNVSKVKVSDIGKVFIHSLGGVVMEVKQNHTLVEVVKEAGGVMMMRPHHSKGAKKPY